MISGVKVAAGILALLFAVETPKGCANQDKGPGEAQGVEVIDPAYEREMFEFRVQEQRKEKRERQVTFGVIAIPNRKIDITWSLATDGQTLRARNIGEWEVSRKALPGDKASLTAEQTGDGGVLRCFIWVDGRLVVPHEYGPKFDPFMNRNDAGDCTATVVVPPS